MAVRSGANPALIGRADELARLRNLLGKMQAGWKGIVLVQGPAGIGKTRLVEQLLDDCPPNVRTVRVKCPQLDPPPYAPFVSICRQLRRIVEEPDERIALDAATDLLTGRAAAGRGALDAAYSRTALFSTFVDRVEPILGARPTAVLIDDAQWIDRASQALLEFVANELMEVAANQGLLLVITSRTTGLGSTAWNPGGLRSRTDFHRLDLGPLAENDRIELVLELGLANPPADVLRNIIRRSNGSPLYLTEAVAHYRSRPPDQGGASAFDLAGIDSLVMTRAESLAPDVQSLLSFAAALGRQFSSGELSSMAGIGPSEVERALEEAVAGGVLRRQGSGFNFDHDLWLDHFHHRTPQNERQHIHDQIAAAHIASDRREPGWIMEASYHLRRGTRRDRETLLRFASQAGDLAFAATAWSDAAENFLTALEAAGDLATDVTITNELRRKAALAHERDMDIETALGLYQDLAGAGQRQGDPDVWADGVDGVMRLSVAFQTDALAGGLAPAPLVDFLEAVPDRDDLRSRMLTTWANLESTAGNVDEAAALAAEAVECAQRTHDDQTLAAALFARGYASLFGLDLETAAESFTRSASLRDRPGLEWVYSECLTRLGWVHFLQGETERAADVAREGVDISVGGRHWSDASLGQTVVALITFARGDLRGAEEQCLVALRFASRAQYSAAPPLIYPLLVFIRTALGDREATEETISAWEETGLRGIKAVQLLAKEELSPPIDDEARCSSRLNLATLATLSAVVELAGHRSRSSQVNVLRRHLDRLGGVVFTTTGQLVERLRAVVALLEGDRRTAVDRLRDAMATADELGALTELAHCHRLLGSVVDDPGLAAQHLAMARALAARIGLSPGLYAIVGSRPDEPPNGEARDRLTIAFSDLVGSTKLSVEEGDHAYMWAIDRSQELLHARCHEHGGVGFGTKGDSFVAYFRSAAAAADFALAAQTDATRLHEDQPAIELKIGLATGEPILRDDMVYGATVNLAARLSDHAQPGTVIADSATRVALRLTHRSESLTALRLKGFPELIAVHRVTARRS